MAEARLGGLELEPLEPAEEMELMLIGRSLGDIASMSGLLLWRSLVAVARVV